MFPSIWVQGRGEQGGVLTPVHPSSLLGGGRWWPVRPLAPRVPSSCHHPGLSPVSQLFRDLLCELGMNHWG